ncbi:MAG: adenylate/guanylate cyclase domain-containing protein, partial [Chloroflexi bacterium]|nr:adenylate/guanylate cyclase domain-containing protein [Chloroflexota bacterium]
MTGAPGRQRPGNGDGEPADSITRGFLFADLRGYTEYVERHGGEAAAQLLARYRELVRAQVAQSRGAEVKTEGDSFYVVFPSVSAAVRAGLAILDLAAQESADPQHAIRVGIGIHAGETVETGEGYVGSPVNIAARLCAQALAGELLVSDTVRALTSTIVRAAFIPKGRRRLKGIAEPMQVFAVSGATAAEPVRPALRVRGSRRVGLALAAIALVVVAVVGAAVLGGR